MALIASATHNRRTCVVGIGALKTCYRMAEYAFNVGNRVSAGWGVVGSGRLADGDSAIVAHAATTRNTRMIKAAIQRQVQKTIGIMAVIAFGDRR